MPSPFPGMDPYLEDPHEWPDVHNSLAGEIKRQLNRTLPGGFFAQVEVHKQMYVGLGDDPDPDDADAPASRPARPDVSVERDPEAAVATLARPVAGIRTEESPYIEGAAAEFASVIIHDTARNREVVTAIEILSPSNKRPGVDRDAYLMKRGLILSGQTGLVEIDLLRTGRGFARDGCPRGTPYVVMSSVPTPERMRSDRLYCVGLADPLPVVAVPLGPDRLPHTLDLQAAFAEMYDGSSYARGSVDYAQPPRVPLDDSLLAIADRIRTDRQS